MRKENFYDIVGRKHYYLGLPVDIYCCVSEKFKDGLKKRI
jgi:hypothetical protein